MLWYRWGNISKMSIDAKVIKFKYRDFVYLIVGSKIIARENKSRPQISLKKKKISGKAPPCTVGMCRSSWACSRLTRENNDSYTSA